MKPKAYGTSHIALLEIENHQVLSWILNKYFPILFHFPISYYKIIAA